MCTLIYKAGYERWKIGNIFMQRLALKHLLEVNVLIKPISF